MQVGSTTSVTVCAELLVSAELPVEPPPPPKTDFAEWGSPYLLIDIDKTDNQTKMKLRSCKLIKLKVWSCIDVIKVVCTCGVVCNSAGVR